jgi:hypothetical protein
MPVQVRNILLAEFIRPELLSKASLLGFYGILPDVSIRVANIELPVTLGILVICHGTPGTFQMQLLVEGPDSTQIFNGLAQIAVAEQGLVTVLFNLAGILFKPAGSFL